MIRVAISVEGATEYEFSQQVLAPYFINNYSIALTAIPMNGNISLDRIKNELKNLLPKYDYVTTFYDLYGFQISDDFTADEIENNISKLFDNNKKLIPYIQKYEFETLLFSDPSYYEEYFNDANAKTEIENIIKSCGGVENINNSRETAPSKRIEKIFNKYDGQYDKVFYGYSIADDIGLDVILKKCDRFREWVNKIKNLTV